MLYSEIKGIIKSQQKAPPVDVVALARALGAKVYRVKEWPDDNSGLIRRDRNKGGDRDFAIYVNHDHPPVRQRFTIAHEIAHMILHDSLIGDGILDNGLYRSRLSDPLEWEANRLAADILMPWHLVGAAMAQGDDTVSKLACRFDVSRKAMSIRLESFWDWQKWDEEN